MQILKPPVAGFRRHVHAVVVLRVLHFGNTCSLHRVHHDAMGLALLQSAGVDSLPQGGHIASVHFLRTMIGEGGSTLSGGEKQRISIARAMLKNAPVVLLDEATASVDPENEVYLQQAISTLVKDKTLIVIAHRLSTIRDAEQILVIDNGKLVQHGKHDELVLQEGIYQKYWNIRQNAKAWKVAQ